MDYLVESKRLAVLLDTIVASYDLPIAGSPTVGYPAPVCIGTRMRGKSGIRV